MIRWPWRRRPAEPPRRVLRIVLSVDGQEHFDISHALALSMIDCHFGNPIVHEVELASSYGPSRAIKLTLSEV